MMDSGQPSRAEMLARANLNSLNPEYSRPFDVHRWSGYPELKNCLDTLIVEIEATEGRQRRRNASSSKKLRDAVRCLALDLYVAWKTDPELLVAVLRGKEHFVADSRYDALFLSYGQFHAAFEGLRTLGYLEIVFEGFNDRRAGGQSRSTRVRATPKLIALMTDVAKLTLAKIVRRHDKYKEEIIILKDKNKKQVDYQDTDLTREMRTGLARINDRLRKSWIDIDISDDEFARLRKRMSGDLVSGNPDRTPIDFTARHLYRVFNNGTWEDGGRFYGGWWQVVPKEFRQHITINGKATVEIDYSGMHVKMLYAMVGAILEGDAYIIPGLELYRGLVKTTFNKLLNAEGRMRVDEKFDANAIGLTWLEFCQRIIEHHHPIRSFMRTGYGVKLQRKDSGIANRIMLRFLDMNYPCLPVHDSFLVHHALENDLKHIMDEEFRREIGVDITLKSKMAPEFRPTGSQPIDMEIALREALGLEEDHIGYNKRLHDWRVAQHSLEKYQRTEANS